jgi:hypothetical protein
LVSAYIYVEGGASGAYEDGSSSKYLTIRCQQAFHTLLTRMGFSGRKPRLVACGGRGKVYDRFCTAHQAGGAGEYVAMWIDSEEPMVDIEQAWKHLAAVTTVASWAKPAGATDDQVLFMTTCMETWIVADRAALRAHYKHKLNNNPLPAHPNLEQRARGVVQDALVVATKDCQNYYAKGKRSFEVLEKLDPAILSQHLPSFVRVVRILNAKL